MCGLASVVSHNKISNGCAEGTPTRAEEKKRQSGKKFSLSSSFNLLIQENVFLLQNKAIISLTCQNLLNVNLAI